MDRMEHFRGRLLHGDELVMDHVEGHLRTKVKPNSGTGEWTGHFEFPAELRSQFVEGARYRLALIDGRSGLIHILVKDECEGEAPCASFHGTGTARK